MTSANIAVAADREMENEVGLDRIVAEALASHDAVRDRIKEYSPTIHAVRTMLKACETEADISLCIFGSLLYVYVGINGSAISDATPLRRTLRKAGWKFGSWTKKAQEDPGNNTIRWEYRKNGHEVNVALRLNTVIIPPEREFGDEFDDESNEEERGPRQICRYVQVGMRMKEEPIYELQCHDEGSEEASEILQPAVTVDDLPF